MTSVCPFAWGMATFPPLVAINNKKPRMPARLFPHSSLASFIVSRSPRNRYEAQARNTARTPAERHRRGRARTRPDALYRDGAPSAGTDHPRQAFTGLAGTVAATRDVSSP